MITKEDLTKLCFKFKSEIERLDGRNLKTSHIRESFLKCFDIKSSNHFKPRLSPYMEHGEITPDGHVIHETISTKERFMESLPFLPHEYHIIHSSLLLFLNQMKEDIPSADKNGVLVEHEAAMEDVFSIMMKIQKRLS